MLKVGIYKQSNYPVSAVKIRKFLQQYFSKKGISSDAEVSVALVGEKKMLQLSKIYLKDNAVHSVLSFTENEVAAKFRNPDDKILLRLGEIVICYAKAFQEAKKENKRIDDKIVELIKHGADHLMGIHH